MSLWTFDHGKADMTSFTEAVSFQFSLPNSIERNSTSASHIHSLTTGRALTIVRTRPARGCPIPDFAVLEGTFRLYQAEVDRFNEDLPDIHLERAALGTQTIGVSFIRQVTSPRVGIGDSNASMSWVKMHRMGAMHAKRQCFEWGGASYVMKRTWSARSGVRGLKQKMHANFKVVLAVSQQLVAVCLASEDAKEGSWRVVVAEGVGQDLEILIILGLMSWIEISRRDQKGWM